MEILDEANHREVIRGYSDAPDLCKLITLVVRAERFSEGARPGALEAGTVQRVLRSLQRAVQGTG